MHAYTFVPSFYVSVSVCVCVFICFFVLFFVSVCVRAHAAVVFALIFELSTYIYSRYCNYAFEFQNLALHSTHHDFYLVCITLLFCRPKSGGGCCSFDRYPVLQKKKKERDYKCIQVAVLGTGSKTQTVL